MVYDIMWKRLWTILCLEKCDCRLKRANCDYIFMAIEFGSAGC